MRVECESCRDLVVASFGVEGDAVRATCPACQHVMTVTSGPEAPPSDAPLCPKCGASRAPDADPAMHVRSDTRIGITFRGASRGAMACASCGLAVDRWAAFSDARDAAVPDPVRDAWTRATQNWSAAAPHDELLQLAATHNCYAWAAGRYRTRRDTVAQRQLERLRRAAEATLFASASARPDATTAPYRATRGVLALLIVAVVVGAVYATVIRERPRRTIAAPLPAQPLTPGHPVSPSTIK